MLTGITPGLKIAALAVAAVAVLYLLFHFSIWWGSRVILRSYRRPPRRVRREFGYGGPEDLGLRSEALKVEVAPGIVLEGWLFRSDRPARGVLVHLHGIWDSCRPRLPLAARMVPLGFDCIFYDSRGNGQSGGRYCTYGAEEAKDLRRVLDHVSGLQVDVSRVAVVGHSMGAATAVYAAARDARIRALVLEACYRDLPTAARDYARLFVPFIPDLIVRRALERAAQVGGFDPDRLSPLAFMPALKQPALIVQGTADRRIKPRYAQELFDAKPEPKELYWAHGARHGRLPFEAGEAYAAKLQSWLSAQMPVHRPKEQRA